MTAIRNMMRLNQSQFAINLLYFIAVTHEHIIFNNFVGSIGFSFRLNIGRLTQKSLKGSIQSLSFLIQVQHSFLDSHYSQKIYLQLHDMRQCYHGHSRSLGVLRDFGIEFQNQQSLHFFLVIFSFSFTIR